MYEIYTVEKNDTLNSVAQKFNTTVPEIYKINNFASNYVLKTNEQIIVPINGESMFDYYLVKKGDSLYEIAKKNNIEPSSLATLNGIDEGEYIYPDQTILIPKDGVDFYITKELDTISSASQVIGNSPIDILLQNQNIYLLKDQLIIYKEN